MKNLLFDALTSARGLDSNHPFAVAPNGEEISYSEFFRNALAISQLLSRLGAAPDDRVATIGEKTITSLAAYVGTIAMGGVYMPLSNAYTDDEIRYFLHDARPKVLLCDANRAEPLKRLATPLGIPHVLSINELADGYAQSSSDLNNLQLLNPRNQNDLAAILYTSGTTGRPKGAMLSHHALASNSMMLKDYWRFVPDDRLIHALPLHHTHGLFVATNVALIAGCTLLFLPKFNLDDVFKSFETATAFMGIPTFYGRLLKDPRLNKSAVRGMRLFVSGSAPLTASAHSEWQEKTGHSILERYGMTEANMICSNPYEGPRKPGAVGPPLPGVSVRIRDGKSGQVALDGNPGILEVKSPGLFSGYWEMPKKTQDEFTADGYFKTGDVARFDDDGFVVIDGRAKDLVITGGVNVYPKEIEDVIRQVKGVEDAAVVGAPHPDFGEGVIAIVVPRAGMRLTELPIQSLLDKTLARFKHPKRMFFQDSLPRNTMGKVQKNEIRKMFYNVFLD